MQNEELKQEDKIPTEAYEDLAEEGPAEGEGQNTEQEPAAPEEKAVTEAPQEVKELMSLEQAGGFLQTVDSFIKQQFKDGVDYGAIPGTDENKKVLLKPGAEKLNLIFQLSAKFTLIEKIEKHHAAWEYEKWDRESKSYVKRKTMGFFHYRFRCDLSRGPKHIASYEGSCSSRERGKETAPANTILKIAQKRAHVSATVLATFSSDRFTVDVDDYSPSEYQSGRGGSGRRTNISPAKTTEDGTVIFRVGKHRDKPITEIPDGYLHWVREQENHIHKQDAINELTARGWVDKQ